VYDNFSPACKKEIMLKSERRGRSLSFSYTTGSCRHAKAKSLGLAEAEELIKQRPLKSIEEAGGGDTGGAGVDVDEDELLQLLTPKLPEATNE